jgi:hypothetical protein
MSRIAAAAVDHAEADHFLKLRDDSDVGVDQPALELEK